MVEMDEEGSSAGLRRVISFSDMILGFYEDGDRTAESSDHDDNGIGGEISKPFWDSQNHLLRVSILLFSLIAPPLLSNAFLLSLSRPPYRRAARWSRAFEDRRSRR